MSLCPRCGEPVEAPARACARCGAQVVGGGRAEPGERRRPGMLARLGLASLSVALLATVGALVASAVRGGVSCEPRNWVDWHVAMRQACLTPAYVCRNMTSSKMLEDPEVRDSFRRALEAGVPEPLSALDELVSGMRAKYGCADAPSPAGPSPHARPSPHAGPSPHPAPRLPPGHPPIEGVPDFSAGDSTRTLAI